MRRSLPTSSRQRLTSAAGRRWGRAAGSAGGTGLRDAVDRFATAPVDNPSGQEGVTLHVLVDEAIPHTPNCDQAGSGSNLDREHFGTEYQRNFDWRLAERAKQVPYA